MTPEPSPSVWLHAEVEVRPSAIQGRGLFATAEILKGVTVVRLGGHLVDTSTLHELLNEANGTDRYVDTVQVAGDCHLVLPGESDAHFGNHSCDPNLWHSGPYKLVTRRDIGAGDELTSDYGTSSILADFSLPCSCLSPSCRSVITGNDWKLAHLQRRYGDHWVPAALSLIESSGG